MGIERGRQAARHLALSELSAARSTAERPKRWREVWGVALLDDATMQPLPECFESDVEAVQHAEHFRAAHPDAIYLVRRRVAWIN